MSQTESAKAVQMQERVALYRQQHSAANRWADGYGPIQHTIETQDRVFTMADGLAAQGVHGDGVPLEEVLKASSRLRARDMPHAVIYVLEPGRFAPHVMPASVCMRHQRRGVRSSTRMT